jgi:signal transduction histidine kinase
MRRLTLIRDLALAVATVVFGVIEALDHIRAETGTAPARIAIVLAMSLAVGSWRRLPSLSLLLVWVAGAVQVANGFDIAWIQFLAVIVAYGVSRYGSVTTIWASALSVPAALLIGAVYVRSHGTEWATQFGLSGLSLTDTRPVLTLGAAASAPLVIPWLIGLSFRMRARAEANARDRIAAEARRDLAELQRNQAQETATIREQQAQLARDVHDVVGHSLAVILSQAQSATYIPDHDIARLKSALANIAGSARSALQDVRSVLEGRASDRRPPNGLDALVQATRDRSGRDIELVEVGTARTLPPDLETVAYRVTQEMLTNALRHGTDASLTLRRDWTEGLRLTLANGAASVGSPGRGISGMKRRLVAIGGDFTAVFDQGTYVATAYLPPATAIKPERSDP